MSPAELPESGFAILALDDNYGGSCPCATITLDDGVYRAHCWRTCSRCEYVGLHYQGSRETAELIAERLTLMDWYGEWPVVEGLH